MSDATAKPAAEATSNTTSDNYATLELTFDGPFLFVWGNDAKELKIFAPICDGIEHAAGVFSLAAEKPITKGLWLKMMGGAVASTKPDKSFHWKSGDCWVMDFGTLCATPPNLIAKPLKHSFFELDVPWPDRVVPLHRSPSTITIHDYCKGSNVTTGRFASGHRLVYSYDARNLFKLVDFNTKADFFCPNPLEPLPATTPPRYEILFRYTSGLIKDDDHTDLKSCFKGIARLMALPWEVSDVQLAIERTVGGDCGSGGGHL